MSEDFAPRTGCGPSILVIFVVARGGNAQIVVAAEIDIIVGRIAVLVDVLDVFQIIDIVIAAEIGVSQGTVRKALDELVGENLLIRRQGKGTFVATHGDPEAFSRFLCLAPDEGELPPFKNVPLACWRAKAGPEVARQLSVGPEAPVIIVRRLLQFRDDPVVFDEIYLPGELFAGLTMDVLRSAESSLYSLFESRYGVRAIRANERLRAAYAQAHPRA